MQYWNTLLKFSPLLVICMTLFNTYIQFQIQKQLKSIDQKNFFISELIDKYSRLFSEIECISDGLFESITKGKKLPIELLGQFKNLELLLLKQKNSRLKNEIIVLLKSREQEVKTLMEFEDWKKKLNQKFEIYISTL